MSGRTGLSRARELSAHLGRREVAAVLIDERYSRRAAWRLAALLSQDEAAQKYCDAISDPNAAVTATRISEWERWPGPKDARRPSLEDLVVLARVYGCAPRDLVGEHDLSQLPLASRSILSEQAKAAVGQDGSLVPLASRADRGLTLESVELRRLFDVASEQSQRALVFANASAVNEWEIQTLFEKVRGVARDHLSINSVELLRETLVLQSNVLSLLEGKVRLSQARDLHVFAGVLDLLVADTAASAGRTAVALRQIELAYGHGVVAANTELQAWAVGILESTVHNWLDRPGRALDRLDKGFPEATRGDDPQYWNSLALYRARVEDKAGALDALEQATVARDRGHSSLLLRDELGGTFAYPVAKQAQVAAVTHLELGAYERAAEAAETALAEYARLPSTERAFGNEASASIDLAHARLASGEPDAAMRALTPVLELLPEQRQDWIVRRASALRVAALNLEKHWGVRVRDAADVLGDFASDTISAQFDVICKTDIMRGEL